MGKGTGANAMSDLRASAMAMFGKTKNRTKNNRLKMVIIGLFIASLLLFGGFLGGSTVATYIAKGTETSGNGILQVKMKTPEAITWKKTPIVGMSNDELRELKYFALSSENGVASFHVKGYQKTIHNNSVCLLVKVEQSHSTTMVCMALPERQITILVRLQMKLVDVVLAHYRTPMVPWK